MSPLGIAATVLCGLWGIGASFVLVLVWNWVREQRRDRRIEADWVRSECARAELEVLFAGPAFGEEQQA